VSAEPSGARHPTVVCDLDGVVWRGATPVPGASEALADLRLRGVRVLYVTNNAFRTRAELSRRLAGMGVDAHPDDVLTSAVVAAGLLAARLPHRARVLVAGGPGLTDEVAAAGLSVVRTPPADAVVVGLDLDFDYDALDRASRAVRAGASFVATNLDPTYPTEDGPRPGAGALVAAVATATGRAPEVAGKPEAPTVAAVRARVAGPACVVGDRPSTDGRLAAALGWPFVLVRSGARDDPEDGPAPVHDGPDLAAVVPGILRALPLP
jgi:HAD superfamily hydrolase (TIGR01450 family)